MSQLSRKVPSDVQKLFDNYTINFVRRLPKDRALEMFQKEFNLSKERAEVMFEMFDQDRNNVLSAWEFYLFYTSFGYDANDYFDRLDKLVVPESQTVDVSGTWDFLKELKTMGGRNYDDEELESCIKAHAGEERCLDRKKFIELVCRVKLTRN